MCIYTPADESSDEEEDEDEDGESSDNNSVGSEAEADISADQISPDGQLLAMIGGDPHGRKQSLFTSGPIDFGSQELSQQFGSPRDQRAAARASTLAANR